MKYVEGGGEKRGETFLSSKAGNERVDEGDIFGKSILRARWTKVLLYRKKFLPEEGRRGRT